VLHKRASVASEHVRHEDMFEGQDAGLNRSHLPFHPVPQDGVDGDKALRERPLLIVVPTELHPRGVGIFF
jgi:hypothetical protein